MCVLGAGMTGAAVALELARRGRRVVVLEAGAVGSGASGRNLGHIATGLGSHYVAAIRTFGRDGARALWQTHRENHARIRELLADIGPCGYDARGGFQLALGREEAVALADSEDLLRDDGFSGEFLDQYMLETRFGVSGFAAAYWCADDAAIDGLAFTRSLAAAAEAAGARLCEATPAAGVETDGGGVRIHTPRGTVRATHAVVALNAFAGPIVSFLAERIRPLRGQCLAFEHDGSLPVPSPAYADEGRVYWRQTPEHLLIGGFDDLALGEESTAELGTTPLIQSAIESFAREHLGVGDAAIVRRWSGIMGISLDGFPLVGPVPGTPIVCAAGFTALGFGYAMLAARWVADLIVSGEDPTPARYRASRPFTPGRWPPWSPSA